MECFQKACTRKNQGLFGKGLKEEKTLWEKEQNCSLRVTSPFPTVLSTKLVLQTGKK